MDRIFRTIFNAESGRHVSLDGTHFSTSHTSGDLNHKRSILRRSLRDAVVAWKSVAVAVIGTLLGLTVANSQAASLLSDDIAGVPRLSSKTVEDGRVQTVLTMPAMGTKIRLTLVGQDKAALEDMAKGLAQEIQAHDDLLTVHRDSPLDRVNRQAGQWTSVPCTAAEVIRQSLDAAKLTDGAFDPTIGSLTFLWKIGFGGYQAPSREDVEKQRKAVDWKRVRLDTTPGRCRVRIGADQKLDLGGIAKGWSDTELLKRIPGSAATGAMIVLGGNTAVYGKAPYGDKWLIGIGQTLADKNYVGYLKLSSGESVTTSAATERHITAGGREYGHIIDPKSGVSADTDIAYTSVVDPDGARGDALSTALFLMGSTKVKDFLRAHPHFRVFVMLKDNTAFVSKSLADAVFVRPGKLKVEEI